MTGTAGLRELSWLFAHQLRNRVRAMALKVRQPRYLIAFLVGVGYFVLVFGPALFMENEREPPPDWLIAVVPFGVVLLLVMWWLRGGRHDVLAFDEAEVHFLFPAPVPRATLIRYRLLKAQVGVLVTVLFTWLFVGRAWQSALLSLPAIWALMTTLHLHQVGASLTRLAFGRGKAGVRRVAIPAIILLLTGVAVLYAATQAIAAAQSAEDLGAAVAAVVAALNEPVPRVAMAPFRALVAPVLAPDLGAWLRAMPALILLLVGHYAWVMRTEAAFEEAAAEAGRYRAELRAAVRAGRGWWRVGKSDTRLRRWVRFPLHPTGDAEAAILWRHALAVTADVKPSTFALAGAGGVAVFGLLIWASGSIGEATGAVAGMAVMFAVMGVFFGPLLVRYDLRRDLSGIEVLRTYPIPPRRLVAAEIAASTLVLTAFQYLLLLVALVLLPLTPVPPALKWLAALGGVLAFAVLPALNALQVTIQNALALLFPGWVKIGGGPAGGIDQMGQNILTLAGAALLLGVLLVPPVVSGLLFLVSYDAPLGRWAAVPAGLAVVATLWAEVVILVRWLARVYVRLDPAEAGLLR